MRNVLTIIAIAGLASGGLWLGLRAPARHQHSIRKRSPR